MFAKENTHLDICSKVTDSHVPRDTQSYVLGYQKSGNNRIFSMDTPHIII